MNPFQSPKFKKLQKEWYGRLKDEGFQDAETMREDTMTLKSWHSLYFFSRYGDSPEKIQMGKRYFDLASAFSHEYKFTSEIEKKVWSLFSEGTPCYQIYQILKITEWKARMIIERIHREMMMKYMDEVHSTEGSPHESETL